MHVESWATALSESTVEVLEKMFFTSVVGEAPQGAVDLAPALRARLRFQGHPSGTLTLNISTAAARSLAANFFGLEAEEVSETQIGEVVGELANMLCGCLLSRVEAEGKFELASPELLSAYGGEPDSLTCAYTLDDGVLGIGLEFHEPAH